MSAPSADRGEIFVRKLMRSLLPTNGLTALILQVLPHETPPPASVASEWMLSKSGIKPISQVQSSRKKDWMKFFSSRVTQVAFLKSLPGTHRHLFKASPGLGILWIALKSWCFIAVKIPEFLPGSESGTEHTHNRDQKIWAARPSLPGSGLPSAHSTTQSDLSRNCRMVDDICRNISPLRLWAPKGALY